MARIKREEKRLSINKDGKGHGGYTLHDGLDQRHRKPHTSQSSLNETPFHSVISFSHVSFDTNIPIFPISVREVMEDIRGNDSIISNKPSLDKSTLVGANKVRKDLFNSVSYGFGDNFKRYIAQRDGSVISKASGVRNFRDEADMGEHYTVKTRYHAIMEWGKASDTSKASTSNISNLIWDMLWNLNVPPRHSTLVWRALKEAIPVKRNLFQKDIRCDPLCPRCHNKIESTYHVFLECDWAKQVWFSSPLTINLNANHFDNLYD
jgi:hypothetical protein